MPPWWMVLGVGLVLATAWAAPELLPALGLLMLLGAGVALVRWSRPRGQHSRRRRRR